MKKLKNILKFAMRLEKQGENFYTYYAEQVKNPYNKKVFEKLVSIERDHYNFIKKRYDELYYSTELHDISWVVDTTEVIHPSIFGDAAAHFNDSNIDDMVSDLAILRMAYTIEDDFSTFYKTVAEKVDDAAIKGFLEALSTWEKGHKDLFYGFYKEQLKDSWGDFEHLFLK
ncbi:MAG: hypothetical protein PWP27_336 [Clostridiales bacterium]|jgi:rubrerythrin|nr:hypothetical protein [Clostridiales bacterium]MDK2932526.1 hypothetical protein [Clostridiales bacterium]